MRAAPAPGTGAAVGSIPARAGIGLRAPHYGEVLERRPAVSWFEVHSENFFGAGGYPHRVLEQVRHDYPVSFHGVGLSLGSTDPIDEQHLSRLSTLVEHYQPGLVSEHVAWCSVEGRFLNDLLPLPYTEEALAHLARRVEQVQDRLGRAILMENPSTYLGFVDSAIPEPEFMTELARRSGCGILLDVNNVYVNARNHGWDAEAYLERIPPESVGEIHLAGHRRNVFADGELLIDSHGAPVTPAVWALYDQAVELFGEVPALIEWDTDIPALEVLLAEAERAEAVKEGHHAVTA